MTFTEFTAYLENFKGLKVDKETVIPLAYYDVQSAVYSNRLLARFIRFCEYVVVSLIAL